MRKPWIWFLFSALWLALAFAAMFFMTRPTPVKAEPVGSIKAALIRPETEDWFSAYPAGHRLIHGQDPVEPEGNKNHDSDKMECGNVAHEGRMISCECHKWQVCGEEQTERKSCQNFCFAKQKCRCVKICE